MDFLTVLSVIFDVNDSQQVKKSVFPNGQKLRRAEVLRKLGIFVNGEIASREFPTYRGPRPNARKPNKNRRNKQSEASATAGVPPQAPGQVCCTVTNFQSPRIFPSFISFSSSRRVSLVCREEESGKPMLLLKVRRSSCSQ